MSRRIVSFLPAATEMAFALGLGDQVLGVSHECDYPAEARTRASVVRSALALETLTPAEVDAAVTERLRSGAGLYEINEAVMLTAAPDLVLTQSLCEVCAPAKSEMARVLQLLPQPPEILWMSPKSLEQIFDTVRDLGAATGRAEAAEALIQSSRSRLAQISARADRAARRRRVFCMEWLDPVYCSGHWVPEMVALAGGDDALGRLGADSVRIDWRSVLDWAPEVLLIMPCGFDLERAMRDAKGLVDHPGWAELPAVVSGEVYGVDANAYFARPGPRVVDGVELLAHLIHPDLFGWSGGAGAFCRLDVPAVAQQRRRAG